MGQKVNPTSFRIRNKYTWKSNWFTTDPKEYQKNLLEDVKLRKELKEKLRVAGVAEIHISRSISQITIRILVSKPGIVIGRGGSGLTDLKVFIAKFLKISETDSRAPKLDIKVEELKKAGLNAYLVAQRIADQLVRRYPHRRAVNRAMESVIEAGAKGIKVAFSGRIGGTEIGRTEKYFRGSIPLHTLRADIDYADYPALTKSGYVGIKVWIHKEE